MNPRESLEQSCEAENVLSAYLFGSRADDGLRLLAGESVEREGSDLDIGVVFDVYDFDDETFDFWSLTRLQVAMEEIFAPLRIDLVPLQRVDPIFQFRAIDGHRIFERDSTRNGYYELAVMRQAAELLPIQRQLERDLFGRSTS